MRSWIPYIFLLSLLGIVFTDMRVLAPEPEIAPYTESLLNAESAATTSAEMQVEPRTEAAPKPIAVPAPESAAPAPSPPPTPTPVSEPASETGDIAAAIEAEIVRLTNLERAKEGAGTLSSHQKLRDIAWAHSADMLARDFFAHDNPEGCSSSCRATNAGYSWRAIGENLYMMSGFRISPAKTAAMVVKGWMDSPGHRANLLKETFTETGIGVVIVGESVYVTALYARPR